ncbi:MAG TPA: glycosyltransferase, partial [Mobilitalea sp.]|nr:glycosyltransferase [Mobilitalea sp.]
NVRWYVIGEGPERSRLEKLIKKKGLENSFILMGKKNNPYPYVKQADIYVHATRYEGKSIAIEEAQILGKAIAASDCTGNSEQIVSCHDGVLFPLTAENIVNEIEWLIDNPTIRKKYEKNIKEKKLEYPEDIEDMLALINT